MATILTKKKDSTGIPATADITNSTGGAELAVNTSDKRLYTKNGSNVIVELGINPSSLDVSGNASVKGTFRITGETNITGAISGNSTLNIGSTISDADGNLRDVPQARVVNATSDLVTTDLGNFVLNTLNNNKLNVPTGDFATGQIISIVNRASAATIVNAVGTTGFILAGAAASTATAVLGNNGVCSMLFIGQNSAYLTGNVS
tara:strand:- start:449 stop:1060 length:612 start_codon:yes stop_codon:yes gene_type:complete